MKGEVRNRVGERVVTKKNMAISMWIQRGVRESFDLPACYPAGSPGVLYCLSVEWGVVNVGYRAVRTLGL